MLEHDPKKTEIVVFAEIPANESKYKIQPDKEYFNQINQDISKELLSVYDEYLTKNTERRNLKKSTFVSPYGLNDYLYKTKEADIEKILTELKTIYDSYLLKLGEHSNLANKRKAALKTIISNFEKENPELDIDKKNFDTFALQRELSNRGYKLPKFIKKDGTFDSILGYETKNVLLDYQTKNNPKEVIDKATELNKYSKN